MGFLGKMRSDRYRKVVVWSNCFDSTYKRKWDDKMVMIVSFFCMIPIMGQILWIMMLISSINDRKVYFKKIKCPKKKN